MHRLLIVVKGIFWYLYLVSYVRLLRGIFSFKHCLVVVTYRLTSCGSKTAKSFLTLEYFCCHDFVVVSFMGVVFVPRLKRLPALPKWALLVFVYIFVRYLWQKLPLEKT